jgi:hypothetical protein
VIAVQARLADAIVVRQACIGRFPLCSAAASRISGSLTWLAAAPDAHAAYTPQADRAASAAAIHSPPPRWRERTSPVFGRWNVVIVWRGACNLLGIFAWAAVALKAP